TRHGPAKAKGLIPLLVKRLRVKWPEAKTFGATTAYHPDAVREYDLAQKRRGEERAERVRHHDEQEWDRRVREERERLEREWKPVWDALGPEERTEIEREVERRWPHY